MTISKVHLVFKTHLDIGFTDFAANVTQLYFTDYIPRAIATARTLREQNSPDRFIWTTGSWLIYEYLEQAEPEQRRALEEAVQAGDITWHGLPFTTHSELMDANLFRFGLSLSQELDRRFGKRTIAAKMSDVPGHTRAIVPLLAEAGIRFLHIGVNEASTMPDVPPVFRWQDPSGAEIIVMYEQGYGRSTVVPGLDEALAFGHSSDNLGPQTLPQVSQIYAEMHAAYPEAVIEASTLDLFAAALLPAADQLPVVTGEIGDTWIHGAGSDPIKLARFRALQRLRSQWIESGQAASCPEGVKDFSRKLILVPEHTWGMDEKTHLADWENYSASNFQKARSQPNFQKFEASWAEQRAYIDQAVAGLEGTPLLDEAKAALAETVPTRLDPKDWQRIQEPSFVIDTRHFTARIDGITGALNLLKSKASGRIWADTTHRLGTVRYQTFSQEDYDRFFDQYIRHDDLTVMLWAVEDYSKRGMVDANPQHRWWLPQNVDMYRRKDENGESLLAMLSFPAQVNKAYGCPKRMSMEWYFPEEAAEARLNVQWYEKPASRLPEALWVSFVPAVSEAVRWQIDKLGQVIDPMEVVPNGNRHLHAVGRSVTLLDGPSRLELQPLDAALLAPGEPSLLNFTNDLPNLARGLHFNLHNNLWGTNFPMWFEENSKFRFIIQE